MIYQQTPSYHINRWSSLGTELLTLEKVEEFEKTKAKFQLNSTLKVLDNEIVEDVWRSGLPEENIPKGK